MRCNNDLYLTRECLYGCSLHSMTIGPYECAEKNFHIAFSPSNIIQGKSSLDSSRHKSLSLVDRVKHFCLGVLLLCPLINLIVVVALRALNRAPVGSKVGGTVQGGNTKSKTQNRTSDQIRLFDASCAPLILDKNSEKNSSLINSWIGNPLALRGIILGKDEHVPNIVSSENVFQACKSLAVKNSAGFFLTLTSPSPSIAAKIGDTCWMKHDAKSDCGWTCKVSSEVPEEYQEYIRQYFSFLETVSDEFKKSNVRTGNSDMLTFTKQDAAMLYALRLKAESNPDFVRMLIRTEKRPITFDDPGDEVWGTGKSGNGQGRFGMVLMILRAELAGEIKRISNQELIRMIEN